MNPERARQKVKSFLLSRTNLKVDIINRLAKERIHEIFHVQGKKDKNISEKDIQTFISDHFSELQRDADGVLNDLCREILPESEWWYVIRQFGFVAVFLVPPLYPLCCSILEMWAEYRADPRNLTALVEAGTGAVGCFLLLFVLVCAVRASFFKK